MNLFAIAAGMMAVIHLVAGWQRPRQRMIDIIFPLCGLSASKATGRHQLAGFPYLSVLQRPAFWGRLLEWKHDNRTRCPASAHELVRGCSLPKRKCFDNIARYHTLCDSIEQGFCSGVDFASVRHVMRKHGTSDNEGPANAQIFDKVDRIRNA